MLTIGRKRPGGRYCNYKTRRSYSEGGTTFLVPTRGRTCVCVCERESWVEILEMLELRNKADLCFLAGVFDDYFKK